MKRFPLAKEQITQAKAFKSKTIFNRVDALQNYSSASPLQCLTVFQTSFESPINTRGQRVREEYGKNPTNFPIVKPHVRAAVRCDAERRQRANGVNRLKIQNYVGLLCLYFAGVLIASTFVLLERYRWWRK